MTSYCAITLWEYPSQVSTTNPTSTTMGLKSDLCNQEPVTICLAWWISQVTVYILKVIYIYIYIYIYIHTHTHTHTYIYIFIYILIYLYIYIFLLFVDTKGACGGAVGWGISLQAGRSWVRFPMVSMEFFIDIILPSALLPWDWLSL